MIRQLNLMNHLWKIVHSRLRTQRIKETKHTKHQDYFKTTNWLGIVIRIHELPMTDKAGHVLKETTFA